MIGLPGVIGALFHRRGQFFHAGGGLFQGGGLFFSALRQVGATLGDFAGRRMDRICCGIDFLHNGFQPLSGAVQRPQQLADLVTASDGNGAAVQLTCRNAASPFLGLPQRLDENTGNPIGQQEG